MSNPFLEPATLYLGTMGPVRNEIKLTGPAPEEAPVLRQHWEYWDGLARAGVLVFGGRILRLDEQGVAQFVYRADSEDAARAVLEADPAVRAGVFRAHGVHPYQAFWSGRIPE